MWVPQIAWQAGSDPAVFALTGYRAFPFVDAQGNWNTSTLSAFLTLLAAGSHIVAISATSDLPAGVTMRRSTASWARAADDVDGYRQLALRVGVEHDGPLLPERRQ